MDLVALMLGLPELLHALLLAQQGPRCISVFILLLE